MCAKIKCTSLKRSIQTVYCRYVKAAFSIPVPICPSAGNYVILPDFVGKRKITTGKHRGPERKDIMDEAYCYF